MVFLAQCVRCKRKAGIKLYYVQESFCERCFKRLIERRFKRALKKENLLRTHENVRVDDKTWKGEVLKLMLEKLREQVPFNIRRRGRIIRTETLDDQAHDYMEAVLNNKNYKFKPSAFEDILDEELRTYAELHNIRTTRKKEDDITKFIEAIENSKPGTKFSIVKMARRIY